MITSLKLTKKTSKITFPEIKHVHAKLLAEDIVSVQSLSSPVANLFYMDIAGETEEMRIIRYEKEELEAYKNEIDDYINDKGRFKFISPGVKYREVDINFIPNRGIEYAADYSANYTNRSLVDRGSYFGDMIAHLKLIDEKRIAYLKQEDFESYDHELMLYLN